MIKDQKLVLFTGGGFLCLWLDLFLGHASSGMTHPGMWVPLIYLPCAVILSVLSGLHSTESGKRLFCLVCKGAIVIGLVGFCFHSIRLWHDVSKSAMQWEVVFRLLRYPPLLAPLAVSGLGVLGVLVTNSNGGSIK